MTLEFRCADVGVVCRGKVRADSVDALIGAVAEHAADAHDVAQLSETLIAYAVTTVHGAPSGDSTDHT